MIRSLYTAASGMSTQLNIQEVISNNLANVDTVGFKKDYTVSRAFQDLLLWRIADETDRNLWQPIGKCGTGVELYNTFTDFSQGHLKYTENKLDLAISGEGFFVVQTPFGERYTRDGSFVLSSTGDLVTKDGFAVLGERGVVNINSSDFSINQDGSIVVNGAIINKLRVAYIPTAGLLKVGKNLFSVKEGFEVTEARNFSILQGYLESSNVNIIEEMIKMISGLRFYESNQKVIHFQDETLEKLINNIPRI